MKTRIVIIAVMLVSMLWLSLAGCNTWDGAGKDVEKAGGAMQRK
jgi:predicted small secreted protein